MKSSPSLVHGNTHFKRMERTWLAKDIRDFCGFPIFVLVYFQDFAMPSRVAVGLCQTVNGNLTLNNTESNNKHGIS